MLELDEYDNLRGESYERYRKLVEPLEESLRAWIVELGYADRNRLELELMTDIHCLFNEEKLLKMLGSFPVPAQS